LKTRARLRRLVYSAIDHTSFLLMLARLRLDDWHTGRAEMLRDQAVREEGEQLRDVHSPR
jgi:hypothetical protein